MNIERFARDATTGANTSTINGVAVSEYELDRIVMEHTSPNGLSLVYYCLALMCSWY